MSDFSLFSLFTAGLACMVPFASAYHQPVGDEPSGNAISQPGLNSLVPAGEGFTITWDPTTSGPVALLLLKGPSTNLKLVDVIVDSTPNTGSYVWTPSTDLEPTSDATGYGIQLIDDKTGQYQYTTQFGISNSDYKAPTSSSSSASAPSYGSSTVSSKESKTASASGYPSFYSGGAMYPTASASNHTIMTTGGLPKPTGGAVTNSTMATTYTSATLSASSSVAASTSASASASAPTSTGAASTMTTSIFGLVLAAGVAVLAY